MQEIIQEKMIKQNLLTDRFGRMHWYLRVSVTERCNIRCQYCMPEEGVPLFQKNEILTFEEISTLVSWFAESGVRKIRFTGGEPTIRKNLDQLVSMINQIPGIETIAMTTNGILLKEQLPDLVKAGMTQFNISLDTLSREKFNKISLRDDFDRVMESIDFALNFPGIEVKINSVAMKNVNDDELVQMIDYFKSYPVELRFIEFMPFAGNHWNHDKFISLAEQKSIIEPHFKLNNLGYSDFGTGTSHRYSLEGFPLVVGFISSLTDQFCSTCSRIRLTADGMFKSCLFENSEIDLKQPLRNGISKDDMMNLIYNKIIQKKESHGGMDNIASHPGRPMVAIGG